MMLELLAVVAADPLSWPLWLVVTFAAGMYPVGFLFGACSDCCCKNDTCDGFDLSAAYEQEDIGEGVYKSGRCLHTVTGAGAYGTAQTFCKRFRDQRPTEFCVGNPPARPAGCQGNRWVRRRSCVRWICRCYESTGERGAGNENVGEWYTVASTTVVGGPTTNGLDLSQELDSAELTCDSPAISLEDYVIQGELGAFTNQPEGTVGCVIYAFVFYGWVIDCEEPHTGIPDQHSPRDDCYTIHPCNRCR